VRVILRDLEQRFGDGPVLFSGLSATLRTGRRYAVVGPSGSGKSTLLGLIAGVEPPTSGTVERSGIDRVGWVFQNPQGVPGRTALDHVVLPFLAAGASRVHAEPQARELLRRFGIDGVSGSLFAALSGGEAQRLMLARAVASGADLLLVDEPTAQLDPVSAASVTRVLAGLADAGAIVVIATHDPRIRDVSDDVIDLAGAP
jgi:ABC-type lipoprotein export system ATPase subunit